MVQNRHRDVGIIPAIGLGKPATSWVFTPSAPQLDKRAACGKPGVDLELFFSEEKGGHALRKYQEARAICAECPVKTACLQWALDNNEQYGVWGGLSPTQRLALPRTRRGYKGPSGSDQLAERGQEWLKLYEQGVLDDEIARRYHVTRTTVRAWRNSRGLPSLWALRKEAGSIA